MAAPSGALAEGAFPRQEPAAVVDREDSGLEERDQRWARRCGHDPSELLATG
jgi:hypothetical protein